MKTLILALAASCAIAYAGPAVIEYKDYRYHTRPYGGIPNSLLTDPYPTKMYKVPQTGIEQPPIYAQPTEPAPAGYHYGQIFDDQCNCYKVILIPNL
jgi:hypothetical protein